MDKSPDPWQFDLGHEEPKEMGDFVLLPEGTYVMRVVGMGLRKEGTPGVVVKFQVMQGKLKGEPFKNTFWTTEKAIWTLKAFLKACGVQYKGIIKLNAQAQNPVGRQLVVRVGQRVDDGDASKLWNEVKGMMSLKEAKERQATKIQAAPAEPEPEAEEPPEASGDVEIPDTIELEDDGSDPFMDV